jgi:uncharacterized membrane protein
MSKKIIKCEGWCPPTVIYLVLSLLSTFISLMNCHKYDEIKYNGMNKVSYTIIHLFFIGLWTWFLYWLCSKCYNTTAWIILLLPIIIIFIMFLFILFSSSI